jgi:ABC-type branched-subunit amino acid transport system substrate-binding protein
MTDTIAKTLRKTHPFTRKVATVFGLMVLSLSLIYCAKKPTDPGENIVTIGYVGALTGELAHYGKDEENGVRD